MDRLTNGYVEAKSYVSCQDRYSVYGCKNSYENGCICSFGCIIIHSSMYSLHCAYIPNSVKIWSILAF